MTLPGCGAPPRLLAGNAAGNLPASPDCPRAAFDVQVSATGRVAFDAARLLAIEPTGAADPGTVERLYRALGEITWAPAADAQGRPRPASARVWVDCSARARPARRSEPAIARALQARDHAAAFLAADAPTQPAARLDVVWTRVAAFAARSPFFYDDLDTRPVGPGSDWMAALRRAEARHGGFWLVRRQRHSHYGDFVFLDARHRVIASAAYRIGE